jgi:Cu(I)/Ag(I) efflux system membrane fusion protein
MTTTRKELMKTKWIHSALMASALSVAVLGTIGCKKSDPGQSGEKARQYTCTHHPEVVQDKPGTCPKCDMKLVEKQ